MSNFILLMSFILRLLWIPINADDVSILGISSCVYSGSYDKSGTVCSVSPMPVSSLPMQCTSFIYDGLIYNGSDFNPPADSITNMKALGNSSKKLFLIYTHGSFAKWDNDLFDNQSLIIEIKKLSSFLKNHAASGIILKDLDYNYTDHTLPTLIDPLVYSNLKDYLVYMKFCISGLKIGVHINANTMMYFHNNPDMSANFFNFTVLNDVVDYYIIGFDDFNPCNDQFRGGIVPLCGPQSLVGFTQAFQSSNIAKDKIYLEFSVNPVPDTGENGLPICKISYQKLCEDKQKKWCADNSESLYYKGQFANETIHAQGIVVKYIDAIDPSGSCNCDSKNQFITFEIMLSGFTKSNPVQNCSAINSLTAVKCSDDGNVEKGNGFTRFFHHLF